MNLSNGSIVKDNGRCGVSVQAGVQTVIDNCILESNAEAGVEAFGKETRLQLDNTQINGNDQCGIRGSRGPMIYLVGNQVGDDPRSIKPERLSNPVYPHLTPSAPPFQVGDPDAMDSTCLVMKDGIRHVITKELPGAQLIQKNFDDYGSDVPGKTLKGYFKVTPSQQILNARAKRKKDAEDAAEAKRLEAQRKKDMFKLQVKKY